jgi:hypothetical protein
VSNLREQLRELSDVQFSDVAHVVDAERAKRAPNKDWRDLDNAEFSRQSEALFRQAEREKAEKAQHNG